MFFWGVDTTCIINKSMLVQDFEKQEKYFWSSFLAW